MAKEIYSFPIRVPVYIKSSKHIVTMSGENVSATFLGPYDKTLEPYIRISTGDYRELLVERGRDNALAAILCSFAHELSHYYQWIKDCDLPIPKLERQAKYYATNILYDYAEIRV